MNLKVVFFGTPSFVIPVIEHLSQQFDLAGVVSAPDTIQGRKKLLTPSPVKSFVTEHLPHIPVLTPEKITAETIAQLQACDADLFVVAAYGKIIPKSVLALPAKGAINIHPSLLPKYRGASPIQSMLLQGDATSGVSIILMDEEVDHGPIISQWKMPIYPSDTFESLHTTMFRDAAEKLPQIITDFVTGATTPQPQNHTEATFCEKITRESGFFAIDNPPAPDALDRMIRAYYPWPTAWTKVQLQDGSWKNVKILPGGKIQMEGKNPVTLKEFYNGYPFLREKIEKLFKKS